MCAVERGRTHRMPARQIAMQIATLVLLGFALTLTPYVTVADSSMLKPSYLLEGRFALGVGMTYQYDGSTGTTLALASWRTRDDHYELGAFRFLTPQTRLGHALAEPNWVFEASRRWRLHWRLLDRSGVDLFFGGGAAYKNKTDDLNGTNWNFAEQLGWRFPKQAGGGRLEFAIRHISNAGIKKPNRGEDFLTLAYVF
jgi:hypothetical protein